MLYDDAVLAFRGLTIFKDFSDPRTYYYLPPEAPRIARSAEGGESGEYALRLVLFRPDPNAPPPEGMEEGGGFLNLDTDLHVSQALLDEATQEIQRKFGADVNLVPVPFLEGSVQLVLLGVASGEESKAFVRKIAGSTVPSLYGSERAAFSVVLDRAGAAVMKAVLEKGGDTMALALYSLTYASIPPAYNLKITIDYKRVYEHLDLRLRAGVSAGNKQSSFVAKAGFHKLMEELKESRAIHVEEVDPVPGEGGRTPTNQDAINEIISNLMGSKWFKPSLTTTGSMTDLSGLVGPAGPGGSGGGSGTSASGSGSGTAGGTAATGAAGTTGAKGAAAAGNTAAAAGATGAARPAAPATPARQEASWTADPGENLGNNRGVDSFRASGSGTQETLVLRGTGATARVGDSPTSLQAVALSGQNVVLDVPAGQTRHVEISWPAQTQVDDTFHLFFEFDRPTPDELDAYKTGTPAPADARFSSASRAKSSASPGGLAGLEPWLRARSGNLLHLHTYASYENNQLAVDRNQQLSERRMEVAAVLLERLLPNRFNSSDRVAHGHVPAAANTVPTITPGGGGPDGHGETSRPEHRVAIISGPTQEARPQSVLRGRLTRAAAPANPTAPTGPTGTTGPTGGAGRTGGATSPSGATGRTGATGNDSMRIEASVEVNLEQISTDEQITAVYELSSRKARKVTKHPQGQLIFDAPDPKKYIIEADGALEFFRNLEIEATTTAQWELDGIHSILVQVRYAPRGDGTYQFSDELVLTPDAQKDTLKVGVLHRNGDERAPFVYDYEYRVTVNYTDDVALGNQRGSVTSVGTKDADPDGWIPTESRHLVIHPRDVTPAVTVNVATGVMQYDLLDRAELALSYGPYRQNLELSADKKNHRLVIRPELGLTGARLRTEGVLYYKDRAQVPLPAQEWAPQELVVINEPRENVLRVKALLADPAGIYERVLLALRYEQQNRIVEQPVELRKHADFFDWSVRLEDPTQRSWSYEATLIKKSGDIDRIDWKKGPSDLLIVGGEGYLDVIHVKGTWLAPLPMDSLIAVKIDLVYEDEPNEVRWAHSELIRQGHSGSFEWVVPIRDASKRRYRVKQTEFTKTGVRDGLPWRDADDTELVLQPSDWG